MAKNGIPIKLPGQNGKKKKKKRSQKYGTGSNMTQEHGPANVSWEQLDAYMKAHNITNRNSALTRYLNEWNSTGSRPTTPSHKGNLN
jgi:hypothetical protein